jgi:hypothetical protein
VAKFFDTFKEFPPRQKPGSFAIEVMETMQQAAKGGAN